MPESGGTRRRIAIVIPVLNEEQALPSLLQSHSETGADEVVFVDGGSSDAGPRMLAASGVRWLQSGQGRAAQMNAGAAVCSAEVLIFLHADTRIGAAHIGDVRRAMQDERVVGGRFDVRLSGRRPGFRIIEWFINRRSRWTRISSGDQAMFVRRDVFQRMGGFAEIPLMEDIEFSRRLKRQGRIACLSRPVITSSRRWERYGMLHTLLLMWRLRLLYWLGTDPHALAARYRDAR